MYDAIIIGAGPGGMSAAWWCHELGLKTLLLEREPTGGGQLLWTHNPIRNYLGLRAADGRELYERFAAHLADANVETRHDAEIVAVNLPDKRVKLSDGSELQARGLILATGVRRRQLDIPGEKELAGRGVMASGARDRELYAGARVCVIGGGDAAAENALLLADAGALVTLVHRGAQLRAREEFVRQIAAHPRIEFRPATVATRIVGAERVEGVELSANRAPFVAPARGVLVRIGVAPNAELFRAQLETDAQGYLTVNSRQETSVANVLAVGDLTNPRAPTIAGATGAGATAAKVLAARLSENQ
jgi:thioredoxin reductase (NADPH)